jgi:hypothetical protein
MILDALGRSPLYPLTAYLTLQLPHRCAVPIGTGPAATWMLTLRDFRLAHHPSRFFDRATPRDQ